MEKSTKQIAESFQCNYTIFERGTDPEEVEQAYRAAFEAGKEGGFYPAVLLLDEYAVEWLQEVARDMGEESLDAFIGDETEGDELDHFIGYISFGDGMLEADALLLEIPVEHPWEVIGYLPMGGWNECPAPEEMIAICKYWYDRYGAVPAVFTHDVMEFYAPLGLNGVDALEAAKEQYAFCTDRVEQGTRTYKISELAAGLAGSTVWYFWWD